MIIKKIKLHNIRSYLDESIELPQGSILLSGDIGSGKSTLLLAVEFALFGLERGVVDGASLLRSDKDEGYVEVEFIIGGKPIIIKRTLKRSGMTRTVTQSSASIIAQGIKKELTATELKSFVLNTLNYSPSLLRKKNLIYRYTVYCPQEEMKKIILESSDARLDTLRKVFDIDKYERILTNCKIFIASLNEKKKEKQGQIADLAFKKDLLKEKTSLAESLKKRSEMLEPSIINVQQELAKLKLELKQQQKNLEKLAKAKARLASVDATLYEKKIQIGQFEQEINEINSMIKKFKLELKGYHAEDEEELKKKISELEHEIQTGRENEKALDRELVTLTARKNSLLADSRKIKMLKVCPVCQQAVTEQHRKKIANEIEQEIETINEKAKEKEKVLNELRAEIKALEQRYKALIEKEKSQAFFNFRLSALKEKEERKAKIVAAISEIKKNLTELEAIKKSETLLIESFKAFEQQHKALEQELEKKHQQEKTLLIEKSALEQNLKDLQLEVKELKQEIEKKEKTALALQKLEKFQNFLTKNFSAIVELIEKQVMLKLNREFNMLFKQWFSALVDDPSIETEIDIDFSPLIRQGGYEISYNYLSGGERTALALAYRLALNQVLNSVLSKINTKGLLILDEPTDGFSSEQLDKMRDVLQQLKTQQLILVSHEEKVESFVEHVIRFVKEGRISKIIFDT